jgi:hypothetical protein
MNKKCSHCGLINYSTSQGCVRCGSGLSSPGESENISSNPGFHKSVIAKRATVCVAVLVAAFMGFYTSLVMSADKLGVSEAAQVKAAITVLGEKGFADEVFMLTHVAVFRSNDNWLNASVEKENAYAATNFPFEIVTVYPDFFQYPVDDVERAAILLHESKHLQGQDEKQAYEFVWKNRHQLGWTADKYASSIIWRETRKLTKEHAPALFVCDFNNYGDCTDR